MKKLLLGALIFILTTGAFGWEYMGEITGVTPLEFSDAYHPINAGRSYTSFVIVYDTGDSKNTIRIREEYIDGFPNIGQYLFKKTHKDGYVLYKVKDKR